MNHAITERIISYWRSIFFIEPILDLSFIVCFIIGIFYHYKNKERLFFVVYFLSGIIFFVPLRVILGCQILTEKQATILLESANTLFELAEFLAFYHFFLRCLLSNSTRKILHFCFYSLLIVSAVFLIMLASPGYAVHDIRVHSLFINVIEFFFLFIMCLAYYRELFTDIPVKNLFNRPSFFIVTSTFFYSILMIPFFLIANDVRIEELLVHNILFACHYLLLIILLISISKAFLCKAPITT
jgi:hypothetical protein